MFYLNFINFYPNALFLYPDPTEDPTLHVVTMPPSSTLVCNSFSIFLFQDLDGLGEYWSGFCRMPLSLGLFNVLLRLGGMDLGRTSQRWCSLFITSYGGYMLLTKLTTGDIGLDQLAKLVLHCEVTILSFPYSIVWMRVTKCNPHLYDL